MSELNKNEILLKPCPFCGKGEAFFEMCDPGCCTNVRLIVCGNMACGAEMYVDTTEMEAVRLWNAREAV